MQVLAHFMQVMKNFQCNPPDLLAIFLHHLIEADWQGPDAAIHVIRDLHQRLQAENRSIAEFEFNIPPTIPNNDHDVYVNSTAARAPHAFDVEQANLQPDQQAVFDTVASHLELDMPNRPLYVHVEGEPGGGKTYLLNVLLSYSRSIGRLTLPAAFPAKVARKFPGGQTAHHWFALSPSRVGDHVGVRAKRPSDTPERDTQPQRVGRQLQQARLIFIDEITMMRADELDALVQKLDELSFTGTKLQTASCLQLNFEWSTYILLLFIAHRLA
jgi:hypothetical protein